MNVLIVLCHPLPVSFNAKIADKVHKAVETAGHIPIFHDLYRKPFNPVMPEDEFQRGYSLDEHVQLYMDEVTESEVLVFIHPDWWGQMPALMKGWIDRVFRPGIAFDHSGKEFLPKQLDKLMSGKRGMQSIQFNPRYAGCQPQESQSAHQLQLCRMPAHRPALSSTKCRTLSLARYLKV